MPIFVGAGTSSFAKGGGGIGFSKLTTSQRNSLSGVVAGTIVYNTSTSQLEVYDGSAWANVNSQPFEASGGSTSTSSRSGYKVHTFTSPGTFTVSGDVLIKPLKYLLSVAVEQVEKVVEEQVL